MILSVIIPSFKDPFLHPTIDDLLKKSELGDQLEVIVVLDGYWPVKPITSDKRVKVLHLGANRGMRGAINAGVSVAQGEFIARFDEHQMMCQGWDKILVDTYNQPDSDGWIVTFRRHELDPYKWEVMSERSKDFLKLMITSDESHTKFTSVTWRTQNARMEDQELGETMAMQGSFWCMKKAWWDKVIVELQEEGYGPHYQDSVEMVFKTWQAGGKLMLNKKGWHAHKHRSFNRTHNIGGEEVRKCFKYSIDMWNDYYQSVIRPRFGV